MVSKLKAILNDIKFNYIRNCIIITVLSIIIELISPLELINVFGKMHNFRGLVLLGLGEYCMADIQQHSESSKESMVKAYLLYTERLFQMLLVISILSSRTTVDVFINLVSILLLNICTNINFKTEANVSDEIRFSDVACTNVEQLFSSRKHELELINSYISGTSVNESYAIMVNGVQESHR